MKSTATLEAGKDGGRPGGLSSTGFSFREKRLGGGGRGSLRRCVIEQSTPTCRREREKGVREDGLASPTAGRNQKREPEEDGEPRVQKSAEGGQHGVDGKNKGKITSEGELPSRR